MFSPKTLGKNTKSERTRHEFQMPFKQQQKYKTNKQKQGKKITAPWEGREKKG